MASKISPDARAPLESNDRFALTGSAVLAFSFLLLPFGYYFWPLVLAIVLSAAGVAAYSIKHSPLLESGDKTRLRFLIAITPASLVALVVAGSADAPEKVLLAIAVTLLATCILANAFVFASLVQKFNSARAVGHASTHP